MTTKTTFRRQDPATKLAGSMHTLNDFQLWATFGRGRREKKGDENGLGRVIKG